MLYATGNDLCDKEQYSYPHSHICLPGVQVTALLVVQVHGPCTDDCNDMHVDEQVILQGPRLQRTVKFEE